jgi:hypothetical protein
VFDDVAENRAHSQAYVNMVVNTWIQKSQAVSLPAL